MRKVCRFEPGTVLYNGVDLAGAPVPLSVQAYAVDVWYDAPAPHSEGSAERFKPALSVLLSSAESVPADNRVPLIQVDLAGRTLKALVDTGTSDDFISSAEVNALGLCPQSSEWSQVTLADGGKQPILGRVTLRLGIGPLRITTQPYVLRELTEAATYILGSSTLWQYGAGIDLESGTLRLRKGTLSCKVPFVSFASVEPEGGKSEAE
ncbi:hypothetical protein Vretifemale_9173, partial [Volvox reticuliferus]